MSTRTRRRGLTAKLSLGSTIPMVIATAIMGLTVTMLVRTYMNQIVERNANNTLSMVSNLLDVEFTGTVSNYLRGKADSNRDLMELFYRRARTGELTEQEAKEQFNAIMLDPKYGLVGETGYLAGVTTSGVLEIHPLSPGVDASGHEFMQRAMSMRNGYLEYDWQNVGETESRAKAGYLSYFAPWDIMVWASSYKSEFRALLDMKEIDHRIRSIQVGKSGYVFLLDDNFSLEAGYDALGIRSQLSEHNNETPDTAADDAPSQNSRILRTPDGRIRVDFAPVPEMNLTAVVVTPLALYDRMVTTIRIVVVIAVVVAAAFIHIFIQILVRRNLRPMHSMQRVVDRVSSGDLTATVSVQSHDEIADMADLFNRLIREFSSVLLKIRSVISVLGDSVQNLSTSTQEIASTSNEQAAAVKEVLSTMEDSDRLSKGVENRVQEVARIANNTKENVEQGFTLIQTSLSKMDEIRSTNADTISGIKTLGDRIESIWDIVNIINGIADQTKIIAFNAELEAAAAGEAGKNFQIVAGEIRRLADSTVDSTNEIKVKITEIQHASDKLIMASEEGTQRIREGWDVSKNIRGVFEDVLSSSEISANSADDISRSMKMQVTSFEQIFLTLKQISESIDSFVESTAYTTEVSDHLKEISESFKSQLDAYTLDTEVSHG
jgi:methyl-accepting chemotaxis protein